MNKCFDDLRVGLRELSDENLPDSINTLLNGVKSAEEIWEKEKSALKDEYNTENLALKAEIAVLKARVVAGEVTDLPPINLDDTTLQQYFPKD